MHGAIGLLAIIALIGFAFGEHAARAVVAVGLVAALVLFVYVMGCVVTGAI